MNGRDSKNEVFMLEDLRQNWQASFGEVRQWLVEGLLVSNVWLPVMSVYEIVNAAGPESGHLSHWEGYVPLTRHCCYRLFKRGSACLREFSCSRTRRRYALPESADGIDIELQDLVVFDGERARFERGFLDRRGSGEKPAFAMERSSSLHSEAEAFDSSFKIVNFEGETYRFGDMQARILHLLHEAALEGEPWQNGKRLLHEAGSQSFTLSNVFKRNPIWRELVMSDGRGSYRLNSKRVFVGEN